jgi:hypothetical protein
MKRALFAFQDASASQGQSEKLIVPCGPRPPFSRLDYPQILLQTRKSKQEEDSEQRRRKKNFQ